LCSGWEGERVLDNSVLALIILGIVLFLFIWDKIPIGLTAMLGAVAMALFGIMPLKDAFAGFGSDTVMLVAGMLTIGSAMYETGFAAAIGEKVMHIKGVASNERLFLAVILVLVVMMSCFVSNTATVALFLPLVSSVAVSSGGKVTKKNTFMAIGAATILGGNLTLVASTPQLVVQGVLSASGGETLGFFTLFAGAFPLVLVMLAYYMTIGYRMQNKFFTFEETVVNEQAGDHLQTGGISEPAPDRKQNKSKMLICACILAGCVAGFVTGFASYGIIAIIGASLCIITGCISFTRASHLLDWSSIAVLGGSLGIAEGMNQSGALTMAAEGILGLLGGPETSPWLMLAAIAVITSLLSHVMSSTATAAVMAPIAIAVAAGIGARPLTFAIMVVLADSLNFSTPIGTTPMTMTLTAGYRFKDYIVVGGVITLITLAVCIITTPLIYGL